MASRQQHPGEEHIHERMVARFQNKPEQGLESLHGEQEGMGRKVWEVEAGK